MKKLLSRLALTALTVFITTLIVSVAHKSAAQADANPPPRLHVRGVFVGDGAAITNANAASLFASGTGPIPTGLLTAGTTNGISGAGGHLLQTVGGQRWNTYDAGSMTNVYGYSYSNSTSAGTALSVSNCWAGKVLLSSGQKIYRITNALVGTTSAVLATVNTDGAASSLSNCVPTTGLITINLSANAGANTAISWWLIQQ